MFESTVRYKKFSLKIPFRTRTYYTYTKFEAGKEGKPGKTLLQILFEHFVKGNLVSCGAIATRYKKVNPCLTQGEVLLLVRKIQAAAKKSKNRALRGKVFVRPKAGGASAVSSRKSTDSRFTPAQKRLLIGTIKALDLQGRKLTYERIRAAFFDTLAEANLPRGLILSNVAIWKAKKSLGLVRPKPGVTGRPKKRPRI